MDNMPPIPFSWPKPKAPSAELFSFVKVSHPAVARTLCSSRRFTGLIFDAEHGAFSEPELETLCALTNLAGMLSVIRVADCSPNSVSRALDRGARAAMIPRVGTVEEVQAAARALAYAPEGVRGYDPTVSAEDYGSTPTPEASETRRLFVQIETRSAYESAGVISRVAGVTDLFVGPADLARDLGLGADVFGDDVLNAMREIAREVADSGVRLSAYVDTPARAIWAAKLGYRSFAIGSDVAFLRAGAGVADDFRDAIHATRPGKVGTV